MKHLFKLTILLLLLILNSVCSYSEPWPFKPQDKAHTVGNVYGEYQDRSGDKYFHSSIDIINNPDAPVYSISNGYVGEARDYGRGNTQGYIEVSDIKGGDKGWIYSHIYKIQINPDTGSPWSKGNPVKVGDFLCLVDYFPNDSFDPYDHHILED